MPTLTCLFRYINDARGLRYDPGDTFEASEQEAGYLMHDAPGCFEVVYHLPGPDAPPEKPVTEEAPNKAIARAPRRKGA